MDRLGIIARINSRIRTLTQSKMKLKKRISLSVSLLFLFAFTTTLHAQIIPTFGLKGGVNFTNFAQTDLDIYEMKTGVMIGAFAQLNVPLSPLSIQPEILYAQYGASIKDADASFDVNYIQIPVLVKLSLDAPGVTPNIHFGPYANILAGAELDVDGGSVDLDELVNGTSFGVIVGAGLDTDKIELGLRASIGASEVFEPEASDEETNLGIAITLGVKF